MQPLRPDEARLERAVAVFGAEACHAPWFCRSQPSGTTLRCNVKYGEK